jgi:hypothetical protein
VAELLIPNTHIHERFRMRHTRFPFGALILITLTVLATASALGQQMILNVPTPRFPLNGAVLSDTISVKLEWVSSPYGPNVWMHWQLTIGDSTDTGSTMRSGRLGWVGSVTVGPLKYDRWYYWRVMEEQSVSPHNYSPWTAWQSFIVKDKPLSVSDITESAGGTAIAYPNPSVTTTTVRYYTREPQNVRIVITNILGQEVRVIDQRSSHGWNSFSIRQSLPSGMYLCRLRMADETVQTVRLIRCR